MKIEKLPSGNYRARVSITRNGVLTRKSITAETKRDINLAIARYRMEMESLKPSKITVGNAIKVYIDSKRNVLSPTTIREYTRMYNKEYDSIKYSTLSEVTQKDIQEFVNEKSAYLSPKSVRCVYSLLMASIKAERQVDFKINLPQSQKTDILIPTEEWIRAIYPVVKGTVMEAPFLLASQCGLRASEICALNKDSIKDGSIVVRKALVYDGSQWVAKEPKTYSSNREVPCSAKIIDILRGLQGDPYIIGLNTQDITHRWEHVLIRAGVPRFHFHALRHYFASMCLLQGIPKTYVSAMLGHGTSRMLDQVYAHIFKGEQFKLASSMIAVTDNLL